MSLQLETAAIDPVGFVADELSARGALVELDGHGTVAVLPAALAAQLSLTEAIVLGDATSDGALGCGLGSQLLDRLVTDVRARVPVANVIWQAEPPRLGGAERFADRLVVRNGVADVLGVAHVSATYLAGIFTWTAEADDCYQGMALVVAHAGTGGEPDAQFTASIAGMIAADDSSAVDRDDAHDARAAIGAVCSVAKRAAFAIGPRLDEVGAAVARRRQRERARIDDYFASLIAEAKRPRRSVTRAALDARVAALDAEHAAKLRDLATRYALRLRLEPVALAAISARAVEIRIRLRRRKGERELVLHVPPGARAPDALACVACPASTRTPLLCDDALHVLCETCAPAATGRPRCPACRPGAAAPTRV